MQQLGNRDRLKKLAGRATHVFGERRASVSHQSVINSIVNSAREPHASAADVVPTVLLEGQGLGSRHSLEASPKQRSKHLIADTSSEKCHSIGTMAESPERSDNPVEVVLFSTPSTDANAPADAMRYRCQCGAPIVTGSLVCAELVMVTLPESGR